MKSEKLGQRAYTTLYCTPTLESETGGAAGNEQRGGRFGQERKVAGVSPGAALGCGSDASVDVPASCGSVGLLLLLPDAGAADFGSGAGDRGGHGACQWQ